MSGTPRYAPVSLIALAISLALAPASPTHAAQVAGPGMADGQRGEGLPVFIPRPVRITAARPAQPALAGTPAQGTLLVTTLADAGPGSLREALASANASPITHDVIAFDPTLAGGEIALQGGPLLVTGPVEIRNDAMLRIGLRSLDNGSGMPNPRRILLVDDGDDQVDSRISLIGLELLDARVDDSAALPAPAGASEFIDESSAYGAAILSAESVTLVNSAIRNATIEAVNGSNAGGCAIHAQATLELLASEISSCWVDASFPVQASGGIAVVGGPFTVAPTRDNGSTVFPSALLMSDSAVTNNTADAFADLGFGASRLVLYPSTVFGPATAIDIERSVFAGNQQRVTSHPSLGGADIVNMGGALHARAVTELSVTDTRVLDGLVEARGPESLALPAGISALAVGTAELARNEFTRLDVQAGNVGGGQGLASAASGVLYLEAANIVMSECTITGNHAIASVYRFDSAITGDLQLVALASVFPPVDLVIGESASLRQLTISHNGSSAFAEVAGSADGGHTLTRDARAAAYGGGLRLLPQLRSGTRGALGEIVLSDSTLVENSASSVAETSGPPNGDGTIERQESLIAYGGGLYTGLGAQQILKSSLIQNNLAIAQPSLDTASVLLQGSDAYAPQASTSHVMISDASSTTIIDGVNGNRVETIAVEPIRHNGGPTRTHALLPGSIAIDAGAADPTITHDQRGYGPRSVGAAPDIGAYECGAQPPQDGNDLFLDDFDLSC